MNGAYRRRDVLAGAVAGAAVLAGCSGGDDTEPTSTPAGGSGGDASGDDTEDTSTADGTMDTSDADSPWEFPAETVGNNWSMQYHDAGMTNYNPASAGPRNAPTNLWEASPLPDQDIRSILLQEDTLVAWVNDTFFAVDASDGSVLWEYGTNARPIGTDENGVYFGRFGDREPLSFEAISTQDRSTKWSRTLDSITYPKYSWYPLLHNGLIIGYGKGTGYTHKVVALNAETGETEWEIDSAGQGSEARFAAAGDMLFELTYKSRRVIDINSGSVTRQIEWDELVKDRQSYIGPIASIAPGVIVLRSQEVPGPGGIRLVESGQPPQEGIRLESADIRVSTGVVPTKEHTALAGRMAIIESSFYIGGEEGTVAYSYDGGLLWQTETPAFSLVADQNSVYADHFQSGTYTLTSFNRDSGDVRWEYEIQETTLRPSNIVVANDKVYLTDQDRIIALG